MSVIDTVDDNVVRTIEVGGHPYAVAAARGRVFVTDYGFYGGQSNHCVSVIGSEPGGVVGCASRRLLPHRRRGRAGWQTGIRDERRRRLHPHPPRHHNGHQHSHGAQSSTPLPLVAARSRSATTAIRSTSRANAYDIDVHQHAVRSSTSRPAGSPRVPIHGAPNALAVSGNRIYVTDTWHSSVVQITARDTFVIDTDAANDPPTLTITRADYSRVPGQRG